MRMQHVDGNAKRRSDAGYCNKRIRRQETLPRVAAVRLQLDARKGMGRDRHPAAFRAKSGFEGDDSLLRSDVVVAVSRHHDLYRGLASSAELRRVGRRHADVAPVPERAPGGDMRGAFRLFALDGPAVAVEHFVRAAQPFRLVLARVQARDRGEEEDTAVAGLPPYRFNVTRGRAVSPLTAAIHPRHATEDSVREQIRFSEIARRLVVVVILHHLRDSPVAVHVAPPARHESVGGDRELDRPAVFRRAVELVPQSVGAVPLRGRDRLLDAASAAARSMVFRIGSSPLAS